MTQRKHVLITGGTGFIGAALLKYLLEKNYHVSVISRRPIDLISLHMDVLLIDDLEQICEPGSIVHSEVADKMRDVDFVVHCAGLAHNLNQTGNIEPFYRINRDVTAALAKLAADTSVQRFIFISTIGVNGNETKSSLNPNLPEFFSESDIPHPHNDYAISKLQAEKLLEEISKTNTLEITIIRPPLIYGSNAKGNFALLEKVLSRNIPLPFASIANQRSILALDNLIEFIGICITNPNAANEVFLIADDEVVSTPSFLRQVANERGKKVILLPCPARLLAWAAKCFGKQQSIVSLVGSLRMNTSKARKLLDWQSKVTISSQLTKPQPSLGAGNLE